MMKIPKIGKKIYVLMMADRGRLRAGVYLSRTQARLVKLPEELIIDIPLGPNQQRKLQKSLEVGV